jgi:O-succinylbenzoate synthase
MNIDSIDLFHLAMPLKAPIAGFDTLQTVLVRMTSGSAVGWGETSPGNAPLAGGEWAAGVFACLRDWMAPAVAGKNITSGENLQESLARFRGNRFAKAGLDTAWWDLHAKQEGKPLHEVIGGNRKTIDVGLTFDEMESVDEFLANISDALKAGFARVKLKFRPGWDIRMVEAVSREFPVATLSVDCEGGLGIEHTEMLCRLDDFGLAMIEQPLPADDLVGHAMVRETISTPLCLDESITTFEQAEMALDLKSAQYINLKQGRVGGITPALAINEVCRGEGVGCWVAAVPQTTIGARAAMALATLENCTYPADHFPADKFFKQDVAEPLLPVLDKNEDGTQALRIHAWSEAGIGVEPDLQLVEKLCIDRATC